MLAIIYYLLKVSTVPALACAAVESNSGGCMRCAQEDASK